MSLNLSPKLPIVPISVFSTWNDKLVLRVGFSPKIHGELVEIVWAFAICKRKLEKSIAGLWAEDDELGKARKMQVLAHINAILLRAINLSNDVVLSAGSIVESACQCMHNRLQNFAVVTVLHSDIKEPVGHDSCVRVLEKRVLAVDALLWVNDLLHDELRRNWTKHVIPIKFNAVDLL